MENIDIIFDTDIGDDIDDALAIGFALNCPEVNIKAITTVYGDTETRAKLALKLLKTFHRENIPVGIGIRKPILGKERMGPINQAIVLDEKEVSPAPSKYDAIDLIISQAMACKNPVIVTVGPLTNLAAALIKEPKIAKKAKLVMMGGAINIQQAKIDYNINCDPEAVRIVVDSGIKVIMVGVQVTTKCQLSQKELDNLANKGLASTELLTNMIKAWQAYCWGQREVNPNIRKLYTNRKKIYPTLHDPLALAVAFDQTLVKMEPRQIDVESRDKFIVATKNKPFNVQVCMEVDTDRFIALFMKRILTDPLANR